MSFLPVNNTIELCTKLPIKARLSLKVKLSKQLFDTKKIVVINKKKVNIWPWV